MAFGADCRAQCTQHGSLVLQGVLGRGADQHHRRAAGGAAAQVRQRVFPQRRARATLAAADAVHGGGGAGGRRQPCLQAVAALRVQSAAP